MNIDYVVISSNQNPFYKDFYEPVSRAWNHFGYKTFMIEVCDEESNIFETEYGIYKKIKKVNESEQLQAQVARLFAFNLVKEKNLLISDIDMMPLNREYFDSRAQKVSESDVLVYTAKGQGDAYPYFPMCYILASSGVLPNILGTANMSFSDFINYLENVFIPDSTSGTCWNRDENFLFDRLSKIDNKVILKDRHHQEKRLCRGTGWGYNDESLKNGEYIDFHLIRPYNCPAGEQSPEGYMAPGLDHKQIIDKVLKTIGA
jgi:hypothetical protein